MGVYYYTCDNCGEAFSDSGTYIQCEHGHYLGPCCFPLMEGCKHMRLDYWIQDQTIETDEYGDAVMEAFCPVCAKGGNEGQRLEDAEKRIVELEKSLAQSRRYEATCHCGAALWDHETENHGAVEMEHPCPNADRVVELEELLRKHALRECAECMGTGSYLGDEDRNGPCDACGGTGRVLPGEVSEVLAERDGGR